MLTSLILAAAAALAAPAEAPATPVQAVSAAHRPAELDRLLAAHDYQTLGQVIRNVSTQPDLVSDLEWLKLKMTEGNSAFVSMLYSRLIWSASAEFPEQPKREWRETALMASLYAFVAMQIDGSRCGDRSAPAHRQEQLVGFNPELWDFAATLSPAERETVLRLAAAVEARTAGRRDAMGDVDFLCRGGMEEMQYNLAHGSSREVPAAPGQLGKTIELSGDGKYVPSERAPAERAKDAAAARASLPAHLAAFLASLTPKAR